VGGGTTPWADRTVFAGVCVSAEVSTGLHAERRFTLSSFEVMIANAIDLVDGVVDAKVPMAFQPMKTP
jgi:hypothetical protein